MKKNVFPKGWDETRVKKLIAHYENQTEEEAVAEDEAPFEGERKTVMEIPNKLVSAVRELLAKNIHPQKTKLAKT